MPKIVKNFGLILILFFLFLNYLIPLKSLSQAAQAQTATTTDSLIYPDSEVPNILPRSSWDNSPNLNALMTWFPQNQGFPSDWQPIERIIVHYTATPNNDPYPAITRIQSIYRFHAVTRGWGDIGYNYLIDQQGKIYEGRYGGNGSRGAHTYYDKVHDNFNYGSIGIALLGDYSSADMAPLIYDSLSRLVGWLTSTNNLNPQEIKKTSLIWNPTKGGFASIYTGPIVLGHGDIEPGNPDPGMVDLNKIRQEAVKYKLKYQNYLYSIAGSDKVYKLEEGARKIYNSLAEYISGGAKYDKIATISQSQLNLFSEGRFFKYVSGTLVQADPVFNTGQETIYLVENGKIRPFETTPENFIKLGFDFKDVKKIPQDELSFYVLGQPIKYGPDNSLVKKSTASNVYFIENGKKRWIGSSILFNFLDFAWSKIKTIAEQDFNSYLEEEAMTYPSGSLVKTNQSSVVYLISGKELHPFNSAQTFVNLKYKWSAIKTLPTQELSSYKVSSPVKYPDGTLVKAEDSPTIYLIKNGIREPILSANDFAKANYKWSDIITLSVNDFNALYPETTASSVSASTLSSPSSSSGPLIRIAIYQVPQNQEIIISSNDSYKLCDANNNCQTKTGQTNVKYSLSTYAKFIPNNQETILEIVSYQDHPSWKPSLNYNLFRGNLEIKYSSKSNGLWVINELNLEDYLKGLAETIQEDPYQYIKAQIVAARTYALNYVKRGGKYGLGEIFHLKNTTSDQLYKGYGREEFAPLIVKAVEETKGEVVTYNSQPIVAAYSSGAPLIQEQGTRSACSVWGGSFCQSGYEYLAGGIKDPSGTEYKYTSCSGANHCVGLSGAGSRRWVALGKTYKEILIYYYIGTKVEKTY